MRDRAIIDKLVEAIYRKFEANNYKGTWTNMSDEEVLCRLCEELNELTEAVSILDFTNAIDEAADIALFAIFFADPKRCLNEH